jgi:hypothetical protein
MDPMLPRTVRTKLKVMKKMFTAWKVLLKKKKRREKFFFREKNIVWTGET